jgi:hypothetical protein
MPLWAYSSSIFGSCIWYTSALNSICTSASIHQYLWKFELSKGLQKCLATAEVHVLYFDSFIHVAESLSWYRHGLQTMIAGNGEYFCQWKENETKVCCLPSDVVHREVTYADAIGLWFVGSLALSKQGKTYYPIHDIKAMSVKSPSHLESIEVKCAP